MTDSVTRVYHLGILFMEISANGTTEKWMHRYNAVLSNLNLMFTHHISTEIVKSINLALMIKIQSIKVHNNDTYLFIIILSTGANYRFAATSYEAKNKWIEKLKYVETKPFIEDIDEIPTPNKRIEIPIIDSDGNCCMHCKNVFRYLVRKFNCGICGLLVCSKCIKELEAIPKQKKEKVCCKCVSSLQCKPHKMKD